MVRITCRQKRRSQLYMFHSSYKPKFYLIFPQVSFQHFNYSCFAAQDFAEQFFCKTSFTDCFWFIRLPFRWPRTGIYILITKYILRKWRSYFPCISLFFSELNKGRPGLIWWLQTNLRPLIILAVQNLMSLRNMQYQ